MAIATNNIKIKNSYSMFKNYRKRLFYCVFVSIMH